MDADSQGHTLFKRMCHSNSSFFHVSMPQSWLHALLIDNCVALLIIPIMVTISVTERYGLHLPLLSITPMLIDDYSIYRL